MFRARISTLLVVAILAPLSVGIVWAAGGQPVQDTMSVNYFVNANTPGAPDGTVLLTNPGTSVATVWADIYVFYPDEEMSECCSCSLTPDGKIVSSSSIDPTAINPVPSIRAWATHILTVYRNGHRDSYGNNRPRDVGLRTSPNLVRAPANEFHNGNGARMNSAKGFAA